ncbi:hypothetical protein BGX26_002796, partial [Mortierella sp. AD094]
AAFYFGGEEASKTPFPVYGNFVYSATFFIAWILFCGGFVNALPRILQAMAVRDIFGSHKADPIRSGKREAE